MKPAIFVFSILGLLVIGTVLAVSYDTILNSAAAQNGWGTAFGYAGFVIELIGSLAGIALSLVTVVLVVVAAARRREWGWLAGQVFLLLLVVATSIGGSFLVLYANDPWYKYLLRLVLTGMPLVLPLVALVYSRRPEPSVPVQEEAPTTPAPMQPAA